MTAVKREMGAAVDAAGEHAYHLKLMIAGVVLSTIFGAVLLLVVQAIF